MADQRFGIRIEPAQHRLRNRKSLRIWSCLVAIGAISSIAGCSSLSGLSNELKYNRAWDGAVMGYRNHAWSAKAWHRRKHQFCNEKYLTDYCNGFRAGYESVADGGNGCTPSFPPNEYWGWRYQSAEGQAKVSSWFAGFPHGARAAEEDGVGNWTQIQTSSNLQAEYTQAGLMNSNQANIYPIPAATQMPALSTPAPAAPAANPSTSPTPSLVPKPDASARRGVGTMDGADTITASSVRESEGIHIRTTDSFGLPK